MAFRLQNRASMKRVLLLAVLAAPAVARAQTINSGEILFAKGTTGQDLVHGPYIDAEECASTTAQINLSWNTALASGQSWPASADYTVYASNKQHTAPNCTTLPDTGNGTNAGSVGSTITATAQTQYNQLFTASQFVTVAGFDCNVTADTSIYVCVQAKATNGGTIVGYALGTIILSTARPDPPGNVSAVPSDDGSLEISWSRPTSATSAYDYVISAIPQDTTADPKTHTATDNIALNYQMKGLVNGVTYTIEVWSRSRAGNESQTPGTTTATPVPVMNFWDLYHDPTSAGGFAGRDSGGCSTGGAGPAALLAIGALLARLRRRA